MIRRVWIACCLTIVCCSLAGAVEKYALAKAADLVLVGRLSDLSRVPWFDGWHIKGTLAVSQVLAGSTGGAKKITYQYICTCCSLWSRPDIAWLANVPGLWYLKRGKKGWRAFGAHCGDPGFRPLSTAEAQDVRRFFSGQALDTPARNGTR